MVKWHRSNKGKNIKQIQNNFLCLKKTLQNNKIKTKRPTVAKNKSKVKHLIIGWLYPQIVFGFLQSNIDQKDWRESPEPSHCKKQKLAQINQRGF